MGLFHLVAVIGFSIIMISDYSLWLYLPFLAVLVLSQYLEWTYFNRQKVKRRSTQLTVCEECLRRLEFFETKNGKCTKCIAKQLQKDNTE